MMGIRPGARLSVECHDLDREGAGVAQADGLCIHAPGLLPGEHALIAIDHLSPHRPDAWGVVGRIEKAAAERVPPACPAYGACGGCVLEHLAYPAQVAWKSNRVRAELTRRPALVGTRLSGCVPSPRSLGYRNKSKLVYGTLPSGRRVLGAFAPRSHRLIDLSGCQVVEPPLDRVAGTLLTLLAAGVEPFDERTRQGRLRYVILRSNYAGRVLAVLVTPDAAFPEGAALARALLAARPEVVGVVHNLNPSRSGSLLGQEERPLAGENVLEERVLATRLLLSGGAFFQVNRQIAELLYEGVARAAALSGSERVVDCYSGVGGIALTLAPRAGEVLGIEVHPGAVANAVAAAAAQGLPARFVSGDVAERLRELVAAEVVVLNPPQQGCANAVLDEVVRLGPGTILYVSCSLETLLRDLETLVLAGYGVESITPYDMLPQTPHIEALAVLRRRERGR